MTRPVGGPTALRFCFDPVRRHRECLPLLCTRCSDLADRLCQLCKSSHSASLPKGEGGRSAQGLGAYRRQLIRNVRTTASTCGTSCLKAEPSPRAIRAAQTRALIVNMSRRGGVQSQHSSQNGKKPPALGAPTASGLSNFRQDYLTDAPIPLRSANSDKPKSHSLHRLSS